MKPDIRLHNMQKLASQRGGKCLSKEYWDSKTKLAWRCSKGHTWDASPAHIKAGSWCGACGRASQKYTIEEMKKLAGKHGFKCLSDSYINSRTKLKWKCAKGHIWMSSASSILQGHYCPHCSGKAKKTIEDMKAFAKKKGGKCLSSEYINKEAKLKWQCAEGHIWKVSSGNVRQGAWCRICSMKQNGLNRRKHSIAGLNKIVKAKGGKCLSGEKEFLNQYSRLTWQCAQGHKWQAASKSIIKGRWCRKCWLNKKRP